MTMFATWLESRYNLSGDMHHSEETLAIAQQALESTPDDHPRRVEFLSRLGRLNLRSYRQTSDKKDLEAAMAYFKAATDTPNAVPMLRIQAAAYFLELLGIIDEFEKGIEIGKSTLDLLPTMYTRLLDRNDQQYVLSEFGGVTSNLCACCLAMNRVDEALEHLERGRAVIINQLLDDRSDISSLQRDCPELAARYQGLLDELGPRIDPVGDGAVRERQLERRRKADIDLKVCLEEVRCVPGYERFLLGRTVAEMQACAAHGYIVVINITGFRSDAVLISSQAVTHITLSDLSASDARGWLSVKWSGAKRSEQRSRNDQFLKYLSWLWDACVKHVLAEISRTKEQQTRDLPRVWWIGSGLASSIPFHAAGSHTTGLSENAYSRVVSSYTPSIKALAHARSQARRFGAAFSKDDLMLVVAMPTSPKGRNEKKAPRDLPGAVAEGDRIVKAASRTIPATTLPWPSVDQVLQTLDKCRIAHFACHGTSDSKDPSNSGLILQRSGPDEAVVQDRLSVHRVSKLKLKRAQIAYLSACSTAENRAEKLSDEMIHVVSGFQMAGFPHVVGCLWPAGDSECAEVAGRFYELTLKGDLSAARDGAVASALREAVMAVRADDLSMPLNWAQYVHFGA